jgi:hypothetical protein
MKFVAELTAFAGALAGFGRMCRNLENAVGVAANWGGADKTRRFLRFWTEGGLRYFCSPNQFAFDEPSERRYLLNGRQPFNSQCGSVVQDPSSRHYEGREGKMQQENSANGEAELSSAAFFNVPTILSLSFLSSQ